MPSYKRVKAASLHEIYLTHPLAHSSTLSSNTLSKHHPTTPYLTLAHNGEPGLDICACNCGATKISIPKSSVPPFSELCHCLACRASSGFLFFVSLPMPTKDVVIEGTPKAYVDKDTDSRHIARRHFCGNCGSYVLHFLQPFLVLAF